VVRDTEQVGFIRRLGVPHRDLKQGLNWKWPVLESSEIESGRAWPQILDPQSLRTIDGVQVVVRISVTCRIVNAERYFLSVEDGRGNIQDVAGGELADVVQSSTADDVQSGRVLAPVLKKVRAQACKWGMRADSVKFIDASESTSYRLWQSQLTSTGQE
jgi:regulator of protease activity HflC (stomatin/prohibitin superfamily)